MLLKYEPKFFKPMLELVKDERIKEAMVITSVYFSHLYLQIYDIPKYVIKLYETKGSCANKRSLSLFSFMDNFRSNFFLSDTSTLNYVLAVSRNY